MPTAHDRRNVSPDVLSLYSQVALALRPTFGPAFAAINAQRLQGYARRAVTLPVPIISLGNITFGGAGKTPLTLSLARWLAGQGYRPGLITNGYAGSLRQRGALVTDGQHRFHDAAAVGEEAVLLARALEPLKVPVAAGMRRERMARLLLDKCDPGCLVLDDGFQYRSLARTHDLVLLDATNPFGAGGQEAIGFLREPPASLARATAILLTKANLLPLLDLPAHGRAVHRDWLREQCEHWAPGVPVFECPVREPQLERVWHPEEEGPPPEDPIADPLVPFKPPPPSLIRDDLPGLEETRAPQRLLPVSALGNPEAFEATCQLAGLHFANPVRYEDHYTYTVGDLYWWNQLIARSTHQGLVVSSKDWVKLHPMRRGLRMPIWVLTMELAPPDWSAVCPLPPPERVS